MRKFSLERSEKLVSDVTAEDTASMIAPKLFAPQPAVKTIIERVPPGRLLDTVEAYIKDFLIPSLEGSPRTDSELLAGLSKKFNHSLQFSEPRATVARDLEKELEHLYKDFVAWGKERRHKARAITEPMLRRQVRDGLRDYIESKIVVPGKRIGKWSKPSFQFEQDGRRGLIYLQSLAKGEGEEILHYAEQLAGIILLTRRKLMPRSMADFFAIVHPPISAEQRHSYPDCKEIIAESEAELVEVGQLERFKQRTLSAARPLNT